MNADAGRRTFVRNMVVGLPVLAGTASFPVLARGTASAGSPPARLAAADARIDLVLRQMAGLHNDMRRRQPTRDDARAAASYLRTLGSHRQEANRDLEASRAMRELIAREGTERLSRMEPRRTLMLEGLAYYGVTAPTLNLTGVATQTRLRAIETIARDGATHYYEDVAYLIETINNTTTVDPSACDAINQAMAMLEAIAATMCLAAAYLPVIIPECFAASVVLAIMKLMNLIAMC